MFTEGLFGLLMFLDVWGAQVGAVVGALIVLYGATRVFGVRRNLEARVARIEKKMWVA